tara:strand:- start:166 stop:555 length:390 start_codon:yes stop_codon:yes gene_type:complete
MSYRNTGKWATLVMHVDGTLSAGDSQAACVMPFDGYIERVTLCVQENGSGSAANEAMVANGSNDLWAADTLQLAHDATNGSTATITRSDMNSNGTALFSEAAVFDLDIDEVAGAGSPANMTVTIHVVGN